MLVVVSDTSPIRALNHLGCVSLLGELYGTVYVPPAVVRELECTSEGTQVVDVAEFEFIRVQSPASRAAVAALRTSLDEGESEALALAQEIGASIVLIDELDGRARAEQLGFVVIGTLGVLLGAKERGLSGDVRPLLDDLTTNLGFFISDELRNRVLEIAGEAD